MSKKKPFAVGFVEDRWEAGTSGLTNEEEFILFRMCKPMWATGKGVHPDDVAPICRFSKWVAKAIPALERKGKLRMQDGLWVNDRALAEHARAQESQSKNTKRGKAGAEERWGKHKQAKSDAQAHTQASPEHCASNSHPDPDPRKNTTEPSISTEARPPATQDDPPTGALAAADDAGGVVQAFDAAGCRAYGEAIWRGVRPWPGAKDHGTARAMLEAGADPALCAAAFDALLAGMAAKGQPPPRSLAYAKGAVADAVAAAADPLPRGAAPTKRPGAALDEMLSRI